MKYILTLLSLLIPLSVNSEVLPVVFKLQIGNYPVQNTYNGTMIIRNTGIQYNGIDMDYVYGSWMPSLYGNRSLSQSYLIGKSGDNEYQIFTPILPRTIRGDSSIFERTYNLVESKLDEMMSGRTIDGNTFNFDICLIGYTCSQEIDYYVRTIDFTSNHREFDTDWGITRPRVWVHELGHASFGFYDTYLGGYQAVSGEWHDIIGKDSGFMRNHRSNNTPDLYYKGFSDYAKFTSPVPLLPSILYMISVLPLVRLIKK